MPTHHFICVDSAYCSVGGRFKFCLLELSGTFFLNILICNWSNPQMQKPWIWKVDCICSSVCNMSFFGCLYDLKIFSNFIIGVCVCVSSATVLIQFGKILAVVSSNIFCLPTLFYSSWGLQFIYIS